MTDPVAVPKVPVTDPVTIPMTVSETVIMTVPVMIPVTDLVSGPEPRTQVIGPEPEIPELESLDPFEGF